MHVNSRVKNAAGRTGVVIAASPKPQGDTYDRHRPSKLAVVTVKWDDGAEETVRADSLTVL